MQLRLRGCRCAAVVERGAAAAPAAAVVTAAVVTASAYFAAAASALEEWEEYLEASCLSAPHAWTCYSSIGSHQALAHASQAQLIQALMRNSIISSPPFCNSSSRSSNSSSSSHLLCSSSSRSSNNSSNPAHPAASVQQFSHFPTEQQPKHHLKPHSVRINKVVLERTLLPLIQKTKFIILIIS